MPAQDRDTPNDEMFNVAYEELRRLARTLKRGREDGTLTPTALVHEAYLKLAHGGRFRAESPLHLKYTVVRAMKHILVDGARRRAAAIHGGQLRRVPLDDPIAQGVTVNPADVLALALALEELEQRNEQLARAFELQYFGGFEVAEIASLMGISDKRAQRVLRLAKASLGEALSRRQSAAGSKTP